jgi:PREDICTED: similar to centaurin, alpha 1
LQVAYSTSPVEELIPHLTRDFIKEGYLWKTGPKIGDSYKKRWFTLDYRKLMYLENPLVRDSMCLITVLMITDSETGREREKTNQIKLIPN